MVPVFWRAELFQFVQEHDVPRDALYRRDEQRGDILPVVDCHERFLCHERCKCLVSPASAGNAHLQLRKEREGRRALGQVLSALLKLLRVLLVGVEPCDSGTVIAVNAGQ